MTFSPLDSGKKPDWCSWSSTKLVLISPMAQMTSAWFFTNDPNHHVSYISAFLPWWFGTWPVGGAKGTSRAICANEASQGAKEVTSKSLEAIYETWGLIFGQIFPNGSFLLEFFPPCIYTPLLEKNHGKHMEMKPIQLLSLKSVFKKDWLGDGLGLQSVIVLIWDQYIYIYIYI